MTSTIGKPRLVPLGWYSVTRTAQGIKTTNYRHSLGYSGTNSPQSQYSGA